jgi:hypothetical protein
LGLGAKSVELVSLEQGAKAAPSIAKFWGATEEFASYFGQYVQRMLGWEFTVVMSPMAIDELLKQCECNK